MTTPKIISIVTILSSLFLNSAYSMPSTSLNKLRVPIGQIEENRMQDVTSEDNEGNITVKDFKPWLSWNERRLLSRAIYAKFKSRQERKEALQSIFVFLKDFSVDLKPGYTFFRGKRTANYRPARAEWWGGGIKYRFPELPLEIVKLANSVIELKEVCTYLVALNKKMSGATANSSATFQYVIPLIAKLADNFEEFMDGSECVYNGYSILSKHRNVVYVWEVLYESVVPCKDIAELKKSYNILMKINDYLVQSGNIYNGFRIINRGHFKKALESEDFTVAYKEIDTGTITVDRQDNEIINYMYVLEIMSKRTNLPTSL